MDLTPFVLEYLYLASFLGSIFLGESLIVSVSTLGTLYSFNIFIISFLCFLGVYFADFLWFLIGESKLIYKVGYFQRFLSERRIPEFVKKKFLKRPVFFMSLVKMVYGIRIISIVYLGHSGVKRLDFLKWNIVPVIIGIAPSLLVGILIGRGFREFAEYFSTTKKILGVLFLAILIALFLNKLIQRVWSCHQKKYLQ